MPALSSDGYAALKSDIEQAGLSKAILVDEHDNIIDGHHRYRACLELGVQARTERITGIGDDRDKRIRILALNLAARALTSEDRKRLDSERKRLALGLLADGRSLREVSRLVGKPHSTVIGWRDTAGRSDHSPQTPKMTTQNAPNTSKNGASFNKRSGPVTREDAIALKQKVLELHSGGMRVSDIESATGVHRNTAVGWINNPDQTPARGRGGSRKRKLDDDAVAELFNSGHSLGEIARQLGAGLGAVGACLKRLGLGRAGKRAKDPLADHISRAAAESDAWTIGADRICAAASVSSAARVADLISALSRLSRAAATLKGRLNKEAGKEE